MRRYFDQLNFMSLIIRIVTHPIANHTDHELYSTVSGAMHLLDQLSNDNLQFYKTLQTNKGLNRL